MGFDELSAARDAAIVNGEHLLLGGTPPGWKSVPVAPAPFYKRRYTWDGDLVMGCTIGCSFCYYRWINNSVDTIGTGQKGLRRICTPEEMIQWLDQSRLFKPERDIVMLCARSDGSMQVPEITEFLRIFPHGNPVFILHRAPFGWRQIKEWGPDRRAIFCTTITPSCPEFEGSPVKPPAQMAGLKRVFSAGIPAGRISVMLGPLNSNNIEAGVRLIRELAELGIQFLTYRGCSVGNFGVAPEDDQLRRLGFLDGGQDEKAHPAGHSYYRMKNWLAPEVERAILATAAECGVRVHRHTGTLYRDEFGMPVPYNRNNRPRTDELGQWGKADPEKIGKYLRWLGFHPLGVRETADGYFVQLPAEEVATEDVAMTVGTEFQTSVLFNNHRLAPTLGDLRFYATNHLLSLPDGWERVIE